MSSRTDNPIIVRNTKWDNTVAGVRPRDRPALVAKGSATAAPSQESKKPQARRDYHIERILNEYPARIDPRISKYGDNIFLPLTPLPRDDETKNRLSPAEVARRTTLIREAIDKARAEYPFACPRISRWLDGIGGLERLSLRDFDFADPRAGVLRHLNKVHLLSFRKGLRERLDTGHSEYLAPGTQTKLYWQDSMRAYVQTKDGQITELKEWDLSIALGGFTVASELEIIQRGKTLNTIEWIRWRFQIYDVVHWTAGAPAVVPIRTKKLYEELNVRLAKAPIPKEVYQINPSYGIIPNLAGYLEVSDTWLLEVEQSSKAHWFEVMSNIFEVPLKKAKKGTD